MTALTVSVQPDSTPQLKRRTILLTAKTLKLYKPSKSMQVLKIKKVQISILLVKINL